MLCGEDLGRDGDEEMANIRTHLTVVKILGVVKHMVGHGDNDMAIMRTHSTAVKILGMM